MRPSVIATCSSLCLVGLSAADGAHASDSAQLEEIVVTAQKRQETVNNTPVAVTALGMAQLQDAGVNTISDMTSAVPNLQIHTLGIADFIGVTIRGVSNLSFIREGNPAVSTYIDGIYVHPPVGFNNNLYDLERVEVLRGPQGTLYGRNATGGNLNVITASPKSSFDANFDISYGNYNDVMTHAMVNVPVSDTLAIRAAVMAHRDDGYFSTEGTTEQDYGASEDVGLRLTGLWTPTESFKWRLSLDGSHTRGTPGGSVQTGANQMPTNGRSPYHQPAYSDPEADKYTENAAIRSRMDLQLTDNLSLAYVAGYQHIDFSYSYATVGQAGAPATLPATRAAVQNVATTHGHELNLILDTENFKNVLGATYFGEWVAYTSQNLLPSINYSSLTLLSDEYGRREVDKSAWGVFDQVTWSPIPTLRLTAGVRYSHDEQVQDKFQILTCSAVATLAQVRTQTPTSPSCAAGAIITTPAVDGTWSKVNWKAGVDFDVSDTALAYASVTTGYKQGGLQPGLPAVFPEIYEPETLTSYEAGTKLRLLDRTLNVRVAGFFEDYEDIQTAQLAFVGGLSRNITANAGGAEIYGVEIESEWAPTDADHVTAYFTWLHARYTEFANAIDPRNNALIPSLAGNLLPNAPETSVRVEYRHDFSLPNGGTLTPQLTYYWQSESFSHPVNVDVYKIRAYSKSDAQLTYAGADDHWRIAAYVHNIEDRAVRNSEFTLFGGVYSDFNAPRTYGVRLSYQY